MPELSKEEQTELQEKVKSGEKLRELTLHPGWKDVLVPRFEVLRNNMINEMLTQKLDLTGFQLVQQSINAVDNILKGIDFAIAQGEEADLRLKSEKLKNEKLKNEN